MSEKKKVAFVINYINTNGPSRVVLGIIKNLDQSYYLITLITLFPGNDPAVVMDLRDRNVIVHECKSLSRLGCICGKDSEFKNFVANGNYDIIHTHGMIPDIVSSHLSCGAKRICTIHNNMFEDYLSSFGTIVGRIFIFLHLHSLRKLDRCICCSSSVCNVMKKKIDHISFIRNGIDSSFSAASSSFRDSLNIPKNAVLFLYAGALNSGKNIVWLIKEFVKYHNENEFLIVLGGGEKEKECSSIADAHVKMLGFQKDVSGYMKHSDTYVSASYSEGFSIAILEALSFGMGLLLSDIPSHKEIFDIRKDIYLGEVFNETNFHEKLERIRKRTIDKKRIALFQEEELSAKRMTREYAKEYELFGSVKCLRSSCS